LKEPLKKFHVDCLTDSGVSEMYTADEHKNVLSSQQKAMSVLWFWETKSVKCNDITVGKIENAPGRQSIN
jgi:hypothetical protein